MKQETLTPRLGDKDDDLLIRSTICNTNIYAGASTSKDTINIVATGGPMTVSGQDGEDVIRVNYNRGIDRIRRTLTLELQGNNGDEYVIGLAASNIVAIFDIVDNVNDDGESTLVNR